jgi:hypothetical protein
MSRGTVHSAGARGERDTPNLSWLEPHPVSVPAVGGMRLSFCGHLWISSCTRASPRRSSPEVRWLVYCDAHVTVGPDPSQSLVERADGR